MKIFIKYFLKKIIDIDRQTQYLNLKTKLLSLVILYGNKHLYIHNNIIIFSLWT